MNERGLCRKRTRLLSTSRAATPVLKCKGAGELTRSHCGLTGFEYLTSIRMRSAKARQLGCIYAWCEIRKKSFSDRDVYGRAVHLMCSTPVPRRTSCSVCGDGVAFDVAWFYALDCPVQCTVATDLCPLRPTRIVHKSSVTF